MLRARFPYAYLMALLLAVPQCLWSQAVSGKIIGTVTDPSGAAIANAKVTATNATTNVQTSAQTGDVGNYTILFLNAGKYSLAVEAPGFRRFVRENVVVDVDSSVRVDAQLEIGRTTSQITVAGAAPLLQTEKTDLSTVVTERQISNLPLISRNPTYLIADIAGGEPATGQLTYHPEDMQEDYRAGVNGEIYGNNYRMLDGIDDNETIQGSAVIVPTADSLAEMKITTNNYDAEFGQVMGAVIQWVTKSGTNAWHGSAFEYDRNSATFARNPFTEPHVPSPFRWNQFGGSAGGPIKRDKLFFFADYQGTRQRIGAGTIGTVPLAAYRNGDFNSLANHPIFDPATGNADGTGRVQFANNMIPSNRIDKVAANLMGLLPLPNLPGTDNNFIGNGSVTADLNQTTGRVDYALSDKTRMFARYTFFDSLLDVPVLYGNLAGGPALGGFGNGNGYRNTTTRSQNLAFNYQRTLTPRLLTEARFGFNRFRAYGPLYDSNRELANQVGLPGINKGDIWTDGLPGFSIAGPVGTFNFGDPASAPFYEREQTLEFVSNSTWVTNAHTLKWGVDVRPASLYREAQNGRGALTFTQNGSGSANVSGSGLGDASFLLGVVQSYTRDQVVSRATELQTRDGVYVNDQWRITRKLTLDLGVRWEFFTPIHASKPGGLTNLNFATGQVLFSNLGTVNASAGLKTYYGNLGPRVGIAYLLNSKTVIRTGYGRSYGIGIGGANFGSMSQRWPNSASQSLSAQNVYSAVFPLDQGPPAIPLPLQPPSSGMLLLPNNIGFIGFGLDNKFDYVDAWNFAVQRQFAASASVEVAYVGNVGRRLFWNDTLNLAIPGPGPANPRRAYYALYGWTQSLTLRDHNGRSSYNALQTKVDKRFAHGYSIMGTFTWQRAMDFGTNTPINPFNWRTDYAPADVDRHAYFSLTHVWELPFNANGPVGYLIHGWSLSGIGYVASGIPFTPTLSNTASLNSPGVTLLPNRLASGFLSNRSRNRWFDPTAFAVPALYAEGDSGRNILRGPSLVDYDMSVARTFAIKEKMQLRFRWDMFNSFNNTNMGQPVTTVDTSTVGRITALYPGATMRRMQFGLHLTW